MPNIVPKKRGPTDRVVARRQGTKGRPAIGLESEFVVLLDGEQVKPEKLFKSPTDFVRQPMMHRIGRSYHLPTGCAVYFDTGVIEIATPKIELEPECPARAGRSLWESIGFVRAELDAWGMEHGNSIHLAGFSTHYNVSFELSKKDMGKHRTVNKLALLLMHILPMPVMMLAANRESTGVGVRPRVNRIEITADFTPDARLLIATASLIVGIVREVMTWPSYELDQLDTVEFPILRDFVPVPHSSRKGWVANISCFPQNPFQAGVDKKIWATRNGSRLSLREIAASITNAFSRSIRHYADPLSRALILDVMRGKVKSMLELSKRPESYQDVGHACDWHNLYSERTLSRSLYERVLLRAISRAPLVIDGEQHLPTGMRGWSHVIFARKKDGNQKVLSLDQLADQLLQNN